MKTQPRITLPVGEVVATAAALEGGHLLVEHEVQLLLVFISTFTIATLLNIHTNLYCLTQFYMIGL